MILVSHPEPFPPGNPFLHDAYHMGTYIGKNVVVMMPNHANEECPYLVVCNVETGERVRVAFKE
jgi:hypothetical protein